MLRLLSEIITVFLSIFLMKGFLFPNKLITFWRMILMRLQKMSLFMI